MSHFLYHFQNRISYPLPASHGYIVGIRIAHFFLAFSFLSQFRRPWPQNLAPHFCITLSDLPGFLSRHTCHINMCCSSLTHWQDWQFLLLLIQFRESQNSLRPVVFLQFVGDSGKHFFIPNCGKCALPGSRTFWEVPALSQLKGLSCSETGYLLKLFFHQSNHV